jgi:2',3'-cyclic-nucleotide 2'-phosphodiesterase (5'-nucleotidase family)
MLYFSKVVLGLCLVVSSAAIPVFGTGDEYERNHNEDTLWFRHMNFIHLTDMHGWIAKYPQSKDTDLGDILSFVTHVKRMAREQGGDVFIFDSGDAVQGSGLSDAQLPHGRYDT